MDRPRCRRGHPLCAAPIAVGVAAVRGGLQGWPPPTAKAASPTAAPSPTAGDGAAVTQAWLKQQIAAALDRQGAALLRGDEKAYLAEVDPAGTATAKRQYASLRALGVAHWEATVSSGPEKQADGAWRVLVRLEHCFASPECTPTPITYGSRWADRPGGVRQVAVEPSLSTGDGPRPWEIDALVATVGKRVVVATTAALRRELPRVVAEAERAAATADRYAVGGAPPERYLVYYAGAEQWKRWYGGTVRAGRPATPCRSATGSSTWSSTPPPRTAPSSTTCCGTR